MKYVLINSVAEGDAARFLDVLNYEDSFELREGTSLAQQFPADAAYRMRDDFPDNIQLHEVLYTLDSLLVVSEKVKAFLEAERVQHVEYLPVKVLNHKDRAVKERYFIVNMLPLVDCIDTSRTKFTPNLLDPEQFDNISNLTVDEKRIPANFQVLRLKHLPGAMLINRTLAEKSAGFRGFKTSEVSEYRAS
jgi:hypothetical protein